MQKYICTKQDTNKRIDHVLENILPEFGLRPRRRFCEQGFIRLNGKLVKAAQKVQEFDLIEFYPIDPNLAPLANFTGQKPYILFQTDNFAAIYKPSQIHSAKIDGKSNCNMEEIVPYLFPNFKVFLLNRLDFSTSGILMLGLNQKAKSLWEDFQTSHLTEKTYFTIVEGHLDSNITICNKLILNKSRIKTNLNRAIHQTKVFPLLHLRDFCKNNLTLVICTITKGARHQIRAHLAEYGHYIINDHKYGAKLNFNPVEINSLSFIDEIVPCNSLNIETSIPIKMQTSKKFSTKSPSISQSFSENFFLHHAKIKFPEFEATCLPTNFQYFPESIQEYLKKILFV